MKKVLAVLAIIVFVACNDRDPDTKMAPEPQQVDTLETVKDVKK